MKLPNATATSSISDAVSRQPHIRSPDEMTTSVRPLPTPLLWRSSDSKRRFGVKSEPLGVLRRPHSSERSCRYAGPVRNLTLSNYSPDLNPDEGLNGDVKQAVTARPLARSK